MTRFCDKKKVGFPNSKGFDIWHQNRECLRWMKNYIYSTFDLSKSLENFLWKVTKLLEIKNISEWDGHIFREREQKIREFALILAGECTVFLLHNLSKSQEFLDKAEQQTRGWWQTTTQKHGCKKRQILTVGNVKVSLKLPYVVERQT